MLSLAALLATAALNQALASPPEGALRVATFNASLHRGSAGELVMDLSTPDDPQARNVAEILQRVRADIILLNEFDHDPEGRALAGFLRNYLAVGQNGAAPIAYAHHFTGPVNTGVPSGQDLDRDGQVVTQPGSRGYGNDAKGYGLYPGQYGMVVLSRFPIEADQARDFREILWKDLPGARLPALEDGAPWYDAADLSALPVSSKAHWDVPVRLGDRALHVLASHPTPPAFDGPEDRNGLRNRDEIRLWADYLTGGERAAYLGGGLATGELFVLLGDQNADPLDGNSVAGAIQQLLEHPRIDATFVPRSAGAEAAAKLQAGANAQHRSDPASDTADFADRAPGNLRVDYVLPARGLKVVGGGVFWPAPGDPLARLVAGTSEPASSDHRLVYLDLELPAGSARP